MEEGFHYTLCLSLDCVNRYIDEITFDISRFGEVKHILSFPSPITEEGAINHIEEYLSVKVDNEYYNKVCNDLFHEKLSDYGESPNRGDLLGDAKFLEKITSSSKKGSVIVWCGS